MTGAAEWAKRNYVNQTTRQLLELLATFLFRSGCSHHTNMSPSPLSMAADGLQRNERGAHSLAFSLCPQPHPVGA